MSRRFVIKYLIGGYGAFGKVAEEHKYGKDEENDARVEAWVARNDEGK